MRSVALNGAEVRTLENSNTGSHLHVIAARGMVFSSWRPSIEELAMFNAGKPVWVIIRGEFVPEFHLQVGDRNEVVPPEIIRRAQKTEALLSSDLGKEVTVKAKQKAWVVEAVAYLYLAACVGGGLMALRLLWRLTIGR